MRRLSTNPKVLLCTVHRRSSRDYLDIVAQSVYSSPKASARCRVSPALRFIKQNVPQVEILEYPLWHEYVAKLKEGWDVVGFTFFQMQIEEIGKMVEEARHQEVREIWAGGYGALDYSIPSMVDRVFLGPVEDRIARVFGYRIRSEEIRHPVMMVHFSIIPGLRHLTFGMLYTTHGCSFKCKFCQNPVFTDKRFTINLESIRQVLEYYHKMGIHDIVLLDELFGVDPKFADKVTRLLARYNFRWWALSRAAVFLRNLDVWHERGLRLPSIGVESMIQGRLDEVNKRQRIEEVLEFARRTRQKPGMYRMAAYMIGYENMTIEETIEDAIRLKQVDFDLNNITVLTPFPRTPLWNELSAKYGDFDPVYRHYNARNLVWNHPHISPSRMRRLLRSLVSYLNRPLDFYRKGLKTLILDELKEQGPRFLWDNLIKGPVASYRIDDRKQGFSP